MRMNLYLTNFDIKIYERLDKILDVLSLHYSKKETYDLQITTVENSFENFGIYPINKSIPKKHVNLKLEKYFKSKNWKENIKHITDWIESIYKDELDEYGGFGDAFSDIPKDIYNAYVSNNFKNGLPPFAERVKYEFDYSDYNIFEQRRILLNKLYCSQDSWMSLKISSLIRLVDECEIIEAVRLEQIDSRFIEVQVEPVAPYIDSIAIEIAILEFEQEFLKKYKTYFLPIEKAISSFKQNFFSIPKSYFPIKKEKKNPIIETHSFFAYQAGILVTKGLLYPVDYTGHNNIKDLDRNNPSYDIVMELVTLLRIKIDFFEKFFDFILNQFIKHEPTHSIPLGSKETTINYLIKFYKNLLNNKNLFQLKLVEGIDYPTEVNVLFTECLIQVLEKKKAINEDRFLDHLLMPNEIKKKGIQLKQETKSPHNLIPPELDRPYFEKIKIRWNREEKYIKLLKGLFEPLFTEKNASGNYFMSEEDVEKLISQNFKINDKAFQPEVFEFNGKAATLRYFIITIYEFIDTNDIFHISKKRWIQFMVQNFDIFSKNLRKIKDKKSYDNFLANQKKSKPKTGPNITIDKERLLIILKNNI